MAHPAPVDLFDHDGPWSEEDFLALPEDRRVELLDGKLLVSPAARSRHQRCSSRLWAALDAAAAGGFEVLEAVNVRVAPGRILIPDVVVTAVPGADVVVLPAADVALVGEIASPGSVVADRAVKPQLYAAAGIRTYLQIELSADGAAATAFGLRDGRYVEFARAATGGLLRLVEPFPVDLDLAALTTPPA